MNSHQKTQEYIKGKSPLFRKKVEIIIFSIRKPQYFISHTKSQRLLVMQHRLSCEIVNLHHHTRKMSLGCLCYHIQKTALTTSVSLFMVNS